MKGWMDGWTLTGQFNMKSAKAYSWTGEIYKNQFTYMKIWKNCGRRSYLKYKMENTEKQKAQTDRIQS